MDAKITSPNPLSAPVHPLDSLKWVDPTTLHANGWNPNRVFGPEFELLKLSILEDGWTQPVVARPDGTIIDGFHRWTLSLKDEDVRRVSGGLVPVVFTRSTDAAAQMMSTVRHNRARGQHGILAMGEIVRTIRAEGVSDEEICRRLGMEIEELDRLGETRSMAERHGQDSFGKG